MRHSVRYQCPSCTSCVPTARLDPACPADAECEKLVQQATGAKTVRAFDHNVRSERGFADGRRLKGGNLIQQPAGIVHGDYTAQSAPRRLVNLGEPPKVNDALKPVLGDSPLLTAAEVKEAVGGRRFVLINVWRSIRPEPVAGTPLACCDAATTRKSDLLTFEIHYADRIGENYFARHSSEHQWYYFPGMERTEALLIKQWDSEGALAAGAERDAVDGRPSTFTLHTAFRDPTTPPEAPSRESIEVRLVALF